MYKQISHHRSTTRVVGLLMDFAKEFLCTEVSLMGSNSLKNRALNQYGGG